MCKIKLLEVSPYKDTRRFQSQLYVGKDTVDFIMESDGVMLLHGHSKDNKSAMGGFGFYPYEGEYEIVTYVKDMEIQPLGSTLVRVVKPGYKIEYKW